MRVVLRMIVVCALLFQKCASRVSETAMSSQSYAINGTYISLNISTVAHTDLAKCPQNISIEASALKYESPTSFSMNLAGLRVSTVNCTYGTDETSYVKLRNHTVSFGRREPMKTYTLWNMTLPDNSLTCINQASTPFYGGYFSFVPVPALQSLDAPDDDEKTQDEMDEMAGKMDYLLLIGNESMEEMCTFFPATQYSEIKKIIEERYQEQKENDDMRIGTGESLKFCTICECGEQLGADLDLNSIEMKEETSPEMPLPERNDEDEEEDWRPPEVLIKKQKCPVAYSNRFEEVVKEEDEDVEENETRDDEKEKRMMTDGIKDTFEETKRLVLYAVVNKLYDEISSELGDEFDDSGFDMRRTIVSLMTSFRRRRVLFMRKGAKCGSRKRPIDKDTVFLYEKKHILRQLHHKKFIRKNIGKVAQILDTEEEGLEAFTLHVLQKNTDGRFSACALSNSRQACALLNQNSFCESFKPLGSMSRATSDGNFGSPPPTTVTGSPPSTGTPQNNGDTATTGQPGDKPTGTGNEGSPNRPERPGQNNGQTPGPSPKATINLTGGQGTPSPSPSPTPIKPSPSPTTQSPSGSNNGLCFPALSKVELEDGGMVQMDELRVGDSIRDGSGSFSKVILFTHFARDIISEFVRLKTDMADIVLSAQHYLPVNRNLMTAESAKIGDTIVILRDGFKKEAIVKNTERVWMRGLFNPQTTSGSIAVWMNGDAVIASTYTAAVDPNVAHSLLAPLRMLNYMVGKVVPWSWIFENGADMFARIIPSGSPLA